MNAANSACAAGGVRCTAALRLSSVANREDPHRSLICRDTIAAEGECKFKAARTEEIRKRSHSLAAVHRRAERESLGD